MDDISEIPIRMAEYLAALSLPASGEFEKDGDYQILRIPGTDTMENSRLLFSGALEIGQRHSMRNGRHKVDVVLTEFGQKLLRHYGLEDGAPTRQSEASFGPSM